MNYKEKPIRLLKDVAKLYSLIRAFASEYENVRIEYDEKLKIVIKDIDPNSNFHYTIFNPRLEKSYTYFTIKYHPKSEDEPIEYQTTLPFSSDNVKNHFLKWLSLIKYFDTAEIHPKDNRLKDLKNRFKDFIVFLEDENDEELLSFGNKILLSEFLSKTIHFIQEDNTIEDEEEKNEIIKDLKELNKSLAQLTQGELKIRFSEIYGTIYYKGIDVVNWMIKEGKSFGFGQLLSEAFKGLIGM